MTQHQIADRGDLRKYRTEIPNSVDDMDLSVYAFRLYVHMKRVAGDSGTCWQSTDTLAKSCKMSKGMIGKAKDELIEKGLIHIEEQKLDRGGRAAHHVTINDIWLENFIKFSGKEPSSHDEQPSSYSELASSPHEQASSPHEIKKEPLLTNNPIKNEKEGARKTRKPREPKQPDPEKEKRNHEIFQIAQALAFVTGMDFDRNKAQILREAKNFKIEDVPIIHRDFDPKGAWYLYDWRGQRGERPGLYEIRKKFNNLKPVTGSSNTPPAPVDERRAGLQRAAERYGVK